MDLNNILRYQVNWFSESCRQHQFKWQIRVRRAGVILLLYSGGYVVVVVVAAGAMSSLPLWAGRRSPEQQGGRVFLSYVYLCVRDWSRARPIKAQPQLRGCIQYRLGFSSLYSGMCLHEPSRGPYWTIKRSNYYIALCYNTYIEKLIIYIFIFLCFFFTYCFFELPLRRKIPLITKLSIYVFISLQISYIRVLLLALQPSFT